MKFYIDNYNKNNSFLTWANVQNNYPTLDIIENQNEYKIEVELPGFTIEDVNLKLEKHILKISSIKKNMEVEEKNSYILKERIEKDFSRSISVGSDVDEEKLKAILKNGLLSITLPKKKQVLSRKIDVKCV